jgi:hypothetical protein
VSLAAERSLYRRFEIAVREGDPLRVHAPPEIACSPARFAYDVLVRRSPRRAFP